MEKKVMSRPFVIPSEYVQRTIKRMGRAHPFEVMDPKRTAFVVIDMQNYFMKPGFVGEVPPARETVGAVNRMARELRARGGHVVWVRNATDETRESWTVLHDHLVSPDFGSARYASLNTSHEGSALWPELEVRPEDGQIVKKRFSAFLPGSSDIVDYLRQREIDTLLIGGTTTNCCCDSSACDAMMLNFKVTMVSDTLSCLTDYEHESALVNFYVIFGDVQSVDEAIASLDRGTIR
jgi:ureidoacrylate peracid hydrolase